MKATHRMRMFHKDLPEGKRFEEGDEIPNGWVDSPDKIGPLKSHNEEVKKTRKKKVTKEAE